MTFFDRMIGSDGDLVALFVYKKLIFMTGHWSKWWGKKSWGKPEVTHATDYYSVYENEKRI